MQGGSDRVDTVAFTADGRTLATGHEGDRDIHLWEVATGREWGRLKGHAAGICSLALSPDGRHLASGSEDSTILIWDMDLDSRRPSRKHLSGKELQRLWAVLGEVNPMPAREAVRILAGAPADSVPFLGERLQPLRAVAANRVASLLAKLGSDDFTTRNKAKQELLGLGEAAEGALRKALAKKPDFELHQRIQRLLAVLAGAAIWPDRVRELRAVEVLERIGNRQARQVLSALARGLAEARLTLEAQAALRRLQRRPMVP
jgi:hypothetical protein